MFLEIASFLLSSGNDAEDPDTGRGGGGPAAGGGGGPAGAGGGGGGFCDVWTLPDEF